MLGGVGFDDLGDEEKVKFSEAEQDKSLPAKLLAELPGILNWALQGCLEWQKNGLGEPDAVTKATLLSRVTRSLNRVWKPTRWTMSSSATSASNA